MLLCMLKAAMVPGLLAAVSCALMPKLPGRVEPKTGRCRRVEGNYSVQRVVTVGRRAAGEGGNLMHAVPLVLRFHWQYENVVQAASNDCCLLAPVAPRPALH